MIHCTTITYKTCLSAILLTVLSTLEMPCYRSKQRKLTGIIANAVTATYDTYWHQSFEKVYMNFRIAWLTGHPGKKYESKVQNVDHAKIASTPQEV